MIIKAKILMMLSVKMFTWALYKNTYYRSQAWHKNQSSVKD